MPKVFKIGHDITTLFIKNKIVIQIRAGPQTAWIMLYIPGISQII